MTDATKPRALDWQRFTGDLANFSRVPACEPTIGIAGDTCDCCGERRIVIAAIHGQGIEVSVALPAAAGLQLANAILDAYAKLSIAPIEVRQ